MAAILDLAHWLSNAVVNSREIFSDEIVNVWQAQSTSLRNAVGYGKVWTQPPLTPEQIAAQKAKDAADKKIAEENALKYNEKLAAQGDPYGLLRMGERYRDGDGVDTNLPLAKIYFQRAINAGSLEASNELSEIKR